MLKWKCVNLIMTQPIVFSEHYDMTLMGLEKLHPFDSAKYGKVHQALVDAGMIGPKDHMEPEEASEELLLKVHAPAYLESLKDSTRIAQVAEVSALRMLPNFLLQSRLLKPMRYATGGTILASQMALQHGWAINLGGGFHHAKAAFGSGFCFYGDINIAAAVLWEANPTLKIMIVDLDAHQGNGFAHTFGTEPRVTVFDVYNGDIYPQDHIALRHVKYAVPIPSMTETEDYLQIVKDRLPKAIAEVKPDLIIYNAGSDIFEEDPLGKLAVSADGVVERDAFVFQLAQQNKIPIAMLLSGGYVKESAPLIARSILNLREKGLIPAILPS